MAISTDFDQTVWYYWEGTIAWALCFIVTFILTTAHAIYMYQDLRSTERKSVSHRKPKPTISKSYSAVLVAILISFLSCNILSLLAIFHFYVTDFLDGSTKCALLSATNAMSYQIAKSSMYIVFIGRIHTVYSQSSYGYKPTYILILVSIVIVISSIFCVLEILFNEHHYKRYSFAKYAMHCNINYADFIVMTVGTFDFIMCFVSALAFIKPLINVYKSKSDSSRDVHTEMQLQRLIEVGQKYMVITCTAVASTMLLMIWIVITDSLLFMPYDIMINCICMALMTPYYKDIQYRRLFWCCNKCITLICIKDKPITRLRVKSIDAVGSKTGTEHESTANNDVAV